MATLTVTINDTHVGRVKDAVQALGPQLLGDALPPVTDVENMTNAEARDVAEAMCKRFLRDVVKQYEAAVAAEQARQAAIAAVDTDDVIT